MHLPLHGKFINTEFHYDENERFHVLLLLSIVVSYRQLFGYGVRANVSYILEFSILICLCRAQ